MLGLRCPCGLELTGENEDQLVDNVNEHLDERHPRVAGTYDRDMILVMSYPIPG